MFDGKKIFMERNKVTKSNQGRHARATLIGPVACGAGTEKKSSKNPSTAGVTFLRTVFPMDSFLLTATNAGIITAAGNKKTTR